MKNTPWKPRPCCICNEQIPRTRSKRATTCSDECQKARIAKYHRSYYSENADQWRTFDLGRKYGLTPEEYDRLLAAAGERCAICRREPPAGKRLVVDHDHDTSAVRGLLCQNCNVMIGMAQENPETLANAIVYLRTEAPEITR
ncbi:endonuclease VII domain-containing protein [Streptomyces sp. NPDC007856]|uniref:endonuclease VII domain-containing protein n=1 Tax=Streptomyces sp. NPDC007856 TaxID=3364781 RepID=UPI0036A10FDE